MTTSEQRQYNHQYEGVPQELLREIAQDVRDWDAAYTEGAKIERVLKKIEGHLGRIETALEVQNKNESIRELRRERAEKINELRLLNELGYEIDRDKLGFIITRFIYTPGLIKPPRREAPQEEVPQEESPE